MTALPYTAYDIIRIAVDGDKLDPQRVLATYANPNNWVCVIANQRNYWAWVGPTIVGYEFAQHGLKDAET